MLHNADYISEYFDKHTVIHTHKGSSLKALMRTLKAENRRIIKMKQIHSNNIHSCRDTSTKTITNIHNVDALQFKASHKAFVIKTADCLPIVISHPSNHFAAIHAGRVGTEAQILKRALTQLITLTKERSHFTVYFGPHICERCYEINRDTKQQYSLIKQNLIQANDLLDFKENKLKLSAICTKCHPLFHSYRETKTKKRNYTIVLTK